MEKYINYVIFTGYYRCQPIQQSTQMTQFMIVPRRTVLRLSAMALCCPPFTPPPPPHPPLPVPSYPRWLTMPGRTRSASPSGTQPAVWRAAGCWECWDRVHCRGSSVRRGRPRTTICEQTRRVTFYSSRLIARRTLTFIVSIVLRLMIVMLQCVLLRLLLVRCSSTVLFCNKIISSENMEKSKRLHLFWPV